MPGSRRRSEDSDDSSRSFNSCGSSSLIRSRKQEVVSKRSKSKKETDSLLNSSIDSIDTLSSSTSSPTENDQNVRVVVRLRPLSTKEQNEQSEESIKALSESCSILVDKNRRFDYDAVFGPETTQSQVYERTARDMVKTNIFKGFNVTILAYGQTGSGKTYTMGTNGGGGEQPSTTVSDGEEGIIPRAVQDLFETRRAMKHGEERVKIEMSYLEIYNEEARDLLVTTTDASPASNTILHIRDGKDGVLVQNLSSVEVKTPREVTDVLEEASQRRHTGSTAMNAVSSRSHAVCTLNVTIAPPLASVDAVSHAEDDDNESSTVEIRAKLTLVDLAGSERLKRTGAEGKRMKEGININKGLFVLGQVISALSELGQQQHGSNSTSHIPYRDSKLTRLLQDSLGGNSRTVMVACVSPADSNVEESVNTLRYAQRTRNIKNSAVQNVVATAMSPVEAAALRRENQMLKLQLLQAQTALNCPPSFSHGSVRTQHGMSQPLASAASDNSLSQLSMLNAEKLEIVTRLRANCSSLQFKVEQLEDQVRSSAEDALTASLKADRWQLKHEQLVATAKAQGVNLPEDALTGSETDALAEKLRKEAMDLKSQLQEALSDAAVARATAAAVVAGDGDLTAAEQLALASGEASGQSGNHGNMELETTDPAESEQLTAELVAVSGEIEQKEAMAQQMNKERECMEALRSHFEGAVQRLQEEVDVLASERESLLAKVQQEDASTKKRSLSKDSSKASHDDATTKRMRGRIKDLESRIKELKEKAAEHTRSLRLREIAEKKCTQLVAEIQEDKKRRAALQRKLKEEAGGRRAEKRAAELRAARMLRDSQKMKYELSKVKEAAARQAVVLRRKASEAVSKQKAMAEQQRKRNMVASMRGNSKRFKSGRDSGRRDELNAWLEREIDSAWTLMGTKDQIDEQAVLLQEASSRKKELLSRQGVSPKATSETAVLRAVDNEIETRSSIIKQLEKNAKEFQKVDDNKSGSSSSSFADASTWNSLSRSELQFIFTAAFDRFVALKAESEKLKSTQSAVVVKAVNKAIAEEKRISDETTRKLKMQHSEAIMTLLESTKGAMEHELRSKLRKVIDEGVVDLSHESVVDSMLRSYLDGCTKIGESVKEELQEVRNQQDGMKKMVDTVAKGLIANNEAAVVNKKKKAKKPSPKTLDVEESFVFEEEEDLPYEDSDDSDWSPDTPARKKKSSKTSAATTATEKTDGTDLSDDDKLQGETIDLEDDLDTLKVAELREMLRQRGLAVSGNKALLLSRLQTSMSATADVTTEEDVVSEPKENLPEQNSFPNRVNAGSMTKRRPLLPKSATGSQRNKRATLPNKEKKDDCNLASGKSSAVAKTADEAEASDSSRKRASSTKLTGSAKKRRRKGMEAAVSRALMEVEKLKNIR